MSEQNKTAGCPAFVRALLAVVIGAMATATASAAPSQTTFTRITTGSIVTKRIAGSSSALGDYDGDGFLDWFVTSAESGAAQRNSLFHNNRDGTFTEFTNTVLTSEAGDWRFAAWGDYDNDGNLDLFVTSTDANGFSSQNQLFRNNGNGSFAKMKATGVGAIVPGGGRSEGCLWADYDRDGFLDMFVARKGDDWLFRNNGDGTFTKTRSLETGLLTDNAESYGASWGDYDDDGWPDLFVAVHSNTGGSQLNLLFHNEGGKFRRVATGAIATDNEHSTAPSWGDYDNDGHLDLFVVNGLAASVSNSLYHNNGDGTFTKMTSTSVGSLVSDVSAYLGCAWGDYDNDGWLDLLVTRAGPSTIFLYHNRGDGTFERVLTGNVVTDQHLFGQVGAWGDYDNDGFLDLFVSRGGHNLYTNLLYRNDGNENSWLKVKCVGTRSNRSAIGVKVRVKATIGGKIFWQLREIHSFNGWAGTPLEAHFGLGHATNVQRLRIEWPSGAVQEFQNVPAKQHLKITEPAQLTAFLSQSTPHITLHGGRNLRYHVQYSSNLTTWHPFGTLSITNLDGTARLLEPNSLIWDPNQPGHLFYRALHEP